MSAITKPRTSPTLLAHLTRLADTATRRNPATAASVESNAIYMDRLVKQGLVEVVDTVKSGKRGRPANLYAPTKVGRERARRAAQKAQA